MTTVRKTAGVPLSAASSKLIMPGETLQYSAEAVLIIAAECEHAGIAPDLVRLFKDLIIAVEEKGFQDAALMRWVIRQDDQADRARKLVRKFIKVIGGPEAFFYLVDLITWSDGRGMQ